MKQLNQIRSFLLEDKLKITIIENFINVQNYGIIQNFTDKEIVLKNERVVTIKGSDLIVSKLLDDEVLIEGNIFSLELR